MQDWDHKVGRQLLRSQICELNCGLTDSSHIISCLTCHISQPRNTSLHALLKLVAGSNLDGAPSTSRGALAGQSTLRLDRQFYPIGKAWLAQRVKVLVAPCRPGKLFLTIRNPQAPTLDMPAQA